MFNAPENMDSRPVSVSVDLGKNLGGAKAGEATLGRLLKESTSVPISENSSCSSIGFCRLKKFSFSEGNGYDEEMVGLRSL